MILLLDQPSKSGSYRLVDLLHICNLAKQSDVFRIVDYFTITFFFLNAVASCLLLSFSVSGMLLFSPGI